MRIFDENGRTDIDGVSPAWSPDGLRIAHLAGNLYVYDRTTNTKSKSGWFSGWFSPTWKSDTTSKLNITTTRTDDSEASVEMKAKLSGDVNVRFKSETFPLTDMTKLLGLQEPALPTTQPRTEPAGGAPA